MNMTCNHIQAKKQFNSIKGTLKAIQLAKFRPSESGKMLEKQRIDLIICFSFFFQFLFLHFYNLFYLSNIPLNVKFVPVPVMVPVPPILAA